MLTGVPRAIRRGDGVIIITDLGTHKRNPSNIQPIVRTPTTSDFYRKAKEHEKYHIRQYRSESPWKEIFTSFQKRTEGGPEYTLMQYYQKVNDKQITDLDEFNKERLNRYSEWINGYKKMIETNQCEFEWQAWKHTEEFEPKYLHLEAKDEVSQLYGCQFQSNDKNDDE